MSYYADDLLTLELGDCVEVMRELPAESVDAVVTDPPYGLEFMGKEWDRLFRTYGPGSGRPTAAAIEKRGGEWAPGSKYGGRAKQPRCMRCGKLMGRGTGVCKCPEPVPHTRHEEAGYQIQFWHEAWAREAFRVAKPGAHLLAFGGTRTYHRLASAIEDAGWEIRDCLVWAYASGFPKSLDVSKAIDKAAGAERERGERKRYPDGQPVRVARAGSKAEGWQRPWMEAEGTTGNAYESAPATPDAAKWDGWGTALKPAWEPIVLARKPLRGTVAANVLAHGTGALNIGATRIPGAAGNGVWGSDQSGSRSAARDGRASMFGQITGQARTEQHEAGRWPANLLLTNPIFDGRVPGVVGGGEVSSVRGGWKGDPSSATDLFTGVGGVAEDIRDSGTYSRFFLIPKSSRSDREPLLRRDRHSDQCAFSSDLRAATTFDEARAAERGQCDCGFDAIAATRDLHLDGAFPVICAKCNRQKVNVPGAACQCAEPEWVRRSQKPRVNVHPTTKPTDLMRHLVRLVTPPGGTVLDPFLGSGTTAIAANAEGFRAIGIEREQEYLDIAVARLAHQEIGLGLDVAAPVRKRGEAKPKPERTGKRGGTAWQGQEGFGSPDKEGRWPEDPGGGFSRFFMVPGTDDEVPA